MRRLVARVPLAAAALACGLALAILKPGPVQAMCGGNIFMTCPPSAKRAAPSRVDAKPAKRRSRRHSALEKAR